MKKVRNLGKFSTVNGRGREESQTQPSRRERRKPELSLYLIRRGLLSPDQHRFQSSKPSINPLLLSSTQDQTA